MKKTGLLKTLAGTLLIGISLGLQGCLAVDENSKMMKKDGDYPGAVVFTYTNEKFQKKDIDALCDASNSTEDSYFYVPQWQEEQSRDYNVDFEMDLTCFKNQIKIPKDFIAPAGVSYPADLEKISDYLREKVPKLNDYDFLAINYVFPVEYYFEGESSVYYALPKTRSFILGTIKLEDLFGIFPDSYVLPRRSSFAHDFNHLLGAKHKFREDGKGCMINSETEEPYELDDIMCARQKDRNGKWLDIYKLEELRISEPTAEEIGW